MSDRHIVTLEHAWFWRCPQCSEDNFARSVEVENLHDQPEDFIRDALGLEPWEELPDLDELQGEFFMAPEAVQCKKCGTEVDCFEPDPDDDEDETIDSGEDDTPSIPDRLPKDL